MEIQIVPPDTELPVERAYVISMVIKSFKGRKDVVVHLYRPDVTLDTDDETYDWDKLLGDPIHPLADVDFDASKKVLLESFTLDEIDLVVDYLQLRYMNRVSTVTACPLDLPVPLGLPPLSAVPEGKTIGFIRFDQIPNYTLPFVIHGYYDLAQHVPLVQDGES